MLKAQTTVLLILSIENDFSDKSQNLKSAKHSSFMLTKLNACINWFEYKRHKVSYVLYLKITPDSKGRKGADLTGSSFCDVTLFSSALRTN